MNVPIDAASQHFARGGSRHEYSSRLFVWWRRGRGWALSKHVAESSLLLCLAGTWITNILCSVNLQLGRSVR